jgi:hypothetical protein
MLTERQRIARAHVGKEFARAKRHNQDPETTPAVVKARRTYKAVSAEEYIRRIVAEAPPLTPRQRADLAALLLTDSNGST